MQGYHVLNRINLGCIKISDKDWQKMGMKSLQSSFRDSIGSFCLSDIPNTLFGPKMALAQSSTDDAFLAYGYHDIFDKKVVKSCMIFLVRFPQCSKNPKIIIKLSLKSMIWCEGNDICYPFVRGIKRITRNQEKNLMMLRRVGAKSCIINFG